jgi:hypothetical protein
MANITPTKTLILPTDGLGDSAIDGWKVSWGPMQAGDIGLPVQFQGYADRSFQLTGAATGTTACEGSNDGGTTWATLSQPNSTPATLTGPGMIAIVEATIQVRPNMSATTGTGLNVIMFFRKTQQNMK